jgi:hypothetical protein
MNNGQGASGSWWRLVPVSTVSCVLCGRRAGQVVDGTFVRDELTLPTFVGRHLRCGSCRGSLLVERDAPINSAVAERLLQRNASSTTSLDSEV